MSRYLFSSHDGYGLGHVRRNSLIAGAILRADPSAEVLLVSGVAVRPSWLDDRRLRIVRVPPMLKNADGAYRHAERPFEEALEERARIFRDAVGTFRPDVVVVDRHPYGIAGELRPGLDLAREVGAAIVLGLRDVLDEPARVRAEMSGDGWIDVDRMFDEVLVYGSRVLCDHVAEYGLPVTPRYVGWVVDRPSSSTRVPGLVAVTAGGGGDGHAVFELGIELSEMLIHRQVLLVAGPYAADPRLQAGDRSRLRVVRDVPGCVELYGRAEATLQMAGYNSTVESLAAGIRPVLVPRRSPRREQAIRASRLAALGLADVVDEGAPATEVAWLLERPRLVDRDVIDGAGIDLDGASVAADAIVGLVAARQR